MTQPDEPVIRDVTAEAEEVLAHHQEDPPKTQAKALNEEGLLVTGLETASEEELHPHLIVPLVEEDPPHEQS